LQSQLLLAVQTINQLLAHLPTIPNQQHPQRAQLESMASSRSLPAGLVTRVRIVLLSAAGKMNQQHGLRLRHFSLA
jgi:hypothetical protein